MAYPYPANRLRISIGLSFLFVGALVYLIDRPPCQTYFISKLHFSLHNRLPELFGSLGQYLPSFVHVFSFILISAAVLSVQGMGSVALCLFWLFIDGAFEICQKFNSWMPAMIPNWFAKVPILENTEKFFRCGTFDNLDLLALIFGAFAAFFVLRITNTEMKNGKARHV
jgi:hypothetical protein